MQNTEDSDLEYESLKLLSLILLLSQFLSAIEQRYIYTEAKDVTLTRPRDSRTHGLFLFLKEREYLDMFLAFL